MAYDEQISGEPTSMRVSRVLANWYMGFATLKPNFFFRSSPKEGRKKRRKEEVRAGIIIKSF